MFNKSKLRGPVGRIYPIAIISCYVIAIVEVLIRRQYNTLGYDVSIGPVFTVFGTALFFFAMGIYQWYRYKLWIYPVMGLLLANGTAHSIFFHETGQNIFTLAGYLISILMVALFIVAAWPKLYGHEKFESRTRRLFKLAVDQISESSSGYTGRPYSAGEATYSKKQINGLARYLKSKYIVNPNYSKRGVFMLFSLGTSVILDPDPEAVSYVFFDDSGKITVHISPFDYKQYTRGYTFDQLCSSFGEMFKRFLEYYLDGHEDRIIAELKSV